MSAVLYPYIYLLARTAFRLTPLSYYQAASLHNRNFYLSVDLPLARPAIVAGLALVLMEVISDFGTVEYFAIETITLGIFTGLANNLVAAAQIAIFAFIFPWAVFYRTPGTRASAFFWRYSNYSSYSFARNTMWLACLCILICPSPQSWVYFARGYFAKFCYRGNIDVEGSVLFNSDKFLNSCRAGCSLYRSYFQHNGVDH